MKKSIIVVIATLGFTTTALASGDMFAKPSNYFDGLYAGIGAGINHTSADADASATNSIRFEDSPQPFLTIAVPLSPDLGSYMAAGEAFVGFGKSFNIQSSRNNFYLGLELFGKLTPTDLEDSAGVVAYSYVGDAMAKTVDDKLNIKLENDYSLGGDLRLGYLISPKIMIYLLAGVDVAKFSYSVSNNGPNFTQGLPNFLVTGDFSDKSNEWKCGIMPGIGIEAMLSNNFSIRAQYTYSYYGDIDVNGKHSVVQRQQDLPTTTLNETNTASADNISRGLFTIALSYHFNGI
jgi:opacity protein-like surface antigen